MRGLAGRDDVVDVIDRAWDRARGGTAQVIVLTGGAGLGKSSVLAWAADHITGHVVHVRGRTQRATTPMTVVTEVVDVLMGDAPRRPAPTPIDPYDHAQAGRVLLQCLRRTVADQGPAALLIDDIHDADPSSRVALGFVLRRLARERLLVLVTSRPTATASSFTDGLDVIALTPLDDGAAHEVLAANAPVPLPPSVAAALVAAAGGNPLALTRLPRCLDPLELSGQRPLPEPLPLDGELHRLFARSVDELSPSPRHLLEWLAVSLDGAWDPVAHVVEGDPEADLRALEDQQLVTVTGGVVRFSHPLLRAAVASSVPAERRRQLHRRLASAPGVAPRDRLLHRAAGTVGHDEDLADELEAMAAHIRDEGGGADVDRLMDRAAALTGDAERRAVRQIAAAQALAMAGATSVAMHRLLAVIDTAPSPAAHCDAALALATLEALNGEPVGAWERLREAAALDPRDASRSRLHAAMAIPLGMLGLVREIVTEADHAVALAADGSLDHGIAEVTRDHARLAVDERLPTPALGSVVPGLDPHEAVARDPMFGLHVGRALAMREMDDQARRFLTHLSSTGAGVAGGPHWR